MFKKQEFQLEVKFKQRGSSSSEKNQEDESFNAYLICQTIQIFKLYKFCSIQMVKASKLILGFVLSGTCISFMAFFHEIQQSSQYCGDGKSNTNFSHPLILTMLMFAGESLCLVYLYFDMRKNGKKYRSKQDMAKFGGRYRSSVKLYALSAFLDFISSIMYYLALGVVGSTSFEILKTGRIIVVALCLKCFTNLVFEKHQVIGSIVTVVGLCIVDIADVFTNEDNGPFLNWWTILMIVPMFFSGLWITYQQRLFLYYYTEPLKLIGYEGVFGMIYCTITIMIFNLVPCPLESTWCVCSNGSSHLQNVFVYFQDVGNHKILILFGVLLMISCAIFNACGAKVTNLINGLARSVMEPLRMILVWIIGIILTVAIDDSNSIYGKWESLDPLVIGVKVAGFSILVFGILLYFEIIRIKGISTPNKDEHSLMSDED